MGEEQKKIDYDDINIEINFHDRKIFSQLNLDLQILHKYYNPQHILGIYYDEKEEKTYLAIIPTFDDMIDCNAGLIKEEIIENNKLYYIRDIRLFLCPGKHPEFLGSLKSKHVLINPKYSHVYDKGFNENYDKIKTSIEKGEVCEELKKAVRDLLRVSLLSNSAVIPFLKQLTDLEKTGLDKLIETIGEEGIFSQSKLASDVGMSRVAVTNLIAKLEDFDMAEIRRLGRGGTYCRIKDPVIIDVKGIINVKK